MQETGLRALLRTIKPIRVFGGHYTKVLLVVSNCSDAGLTNGVIRQLGLSKSQLPEAMDFISANLNKDDPYLRSSAVTAVSRLG